MARFCTTHMYSHHHQLHRQNNVYRESQVRLFYFFSIVQRNGGTRKKFLFQQLHSAMLCQREKPVSLLTHTHTHTHNICTRPHVFLLLQRTLHNMKLEKKTIEFKSSGERVHIGFQKNLTAAYPHPHAPHIHIGKHIQSQHI